MDFNLVPELSRVSISGRSSVHPIHATAGGVTGSLTMAFTKTGSVTARGLHGRIEVPLASLTADNPLVEAETRRRIDARRFPTITGAITAVDRVDAGHVWLRGELCFRGETRDVEGEVDVARGDDGVVTVTGRQTFDVRDWGLQPPRLLLLKVYPDIVVDIALTATPRPE